MTQTAHAEPDIQAEPFSERLLRALNDGALCLMISIGHRTGAVRHDEPAAASHERPRLPPRPASASATCASGSARW